MRDSRRETAISNSYQFPDLQGADVLKKKKKKKKPVDGEAAAGSEDDDASFGTFAATSKKKKKAVKKVGTTFVYLFFPVSHNAIYPDNFSFVGNGGGRGCRGRS